MLSNDYIVGLVDGEGSFTAYVRYPGGISNKIRRVHIEPRFYVKLIARDKPILDALKKHFKCGKVYFQKDARKNHQQCFRFEVANRKHLQDIILPFFRKNHLKFPSKSHDFKVFCEIMKRIKRGEHLKESGLKKLYLLKQAMH